MIVLVVHSYGILGDPLESYAPISCDRHRITLWTTVESVKTISRQIEILGSCSDVKFLQHAPYPLKLIGPDAARISVVPKTLECPASEAPDHVVILRQCPGMSSTA